MFLWLWIQGQSVFLSLALFNLLALVLGPGCVSLAGPPPFFFPTEPYWVLGTGPKTFTRATRALNHRTISSVDEPPYTGDKRTDEEGRIITNH